MEENETDRAYAFWRRVDGLRKGTLQELADVMQIKEQSLRVMRSRCTIPRALTVKALAEHLGTTSSYLLTGEEGTEPANPKELPEVDFVRRSTEAQTLIRVLMRNPKLLDALAVAINNEENNSNK